MNIPGKELSDDPVFQRILKLLKEQNKTQKNLIDEIGDYLNVTPGCLLKGNMNDVDVEGFTPREIEMLHRIRKLSEEQQAAVNNLLKTMV